MANISLFNSLPPGKGQPHVCDEIISLADFLGAVKHGKWQNIVAPIREQQDKKKRDQLKKRLPTVTIGGVFKERKQDLLIQHSGFICVDIDHFNDKTALLQDRYTYALFNSVSGNGIAVVIKVNPDKHKESYKWISEYYYATYGISVDPAPKNVASLRYVSYDPELFINEKSLKSKTRSNKPKKPKSIPVILGNDQVSELVDEVQKSGVNIAPDYDSYLKLGFALANGFGEEGRKYFHALCQPSEKYDSKQTDNQYDRCLQGANRSGVTVGTFYFMLKDAGFSLPQTNQRAVQVAAMAKKSGRTEEAVIIQLQEMENIPQPQAEAIANQVFERDDINLSAVAKDPDQLIQSLIEWVAQNHPIRVNAITRMIEENGNDVKKERLNSIYLRARMCFNTKEVTKDLIESIIFSDMIPEFNPITEFIDKNRHRNSTGNVEALIDSIKTDTPNAGLFIKKWLISIIAAYDGNPVRSVLALVGGQNTGKTEWFRRLLPSEIKKYYAESKLDAGKDDEILMTQKLIVMDDEMGGKSKQDEKRFKELTSKSVFSLRAPYGRYNEDFKRLAILCGTSNDPNVINDPTGNTRIFPVNVLSINHEKYNGIDKNELFMELVRMYESGDEWSLTKDEVAELGVLSNDYEVIPFERELICEFFKPAEMGGGYVEHLTSTQIKAYIEKNSGQRILSIRKFGLELKNVFGNSKSRRIGGKVFKTYDVIKDSGNTQATDSEDFPF